MAEENKTLFRCDKTVGNFITNVIRRYGVEKTSGSEEEIVDRIIMEEKRTIICKCLKQQQKIFAINELLLTEEEKDMIRSTISNRVSICYFISSHLKRLLMGEIDIPGFIMRAEKEITYLVRLKLGEMDLADDEDDVDTYDDPFNGSNEYDGNDE